MAKSKLERVDKEMCDLIDKLVSKGLKRVDATKHIAQKYESDGKYAGFID
jgi:hypothetical protein